MNIDEFYVVLVDGSFVKFVDSGVEFGVIIVCGEDVDFFFFGYDDFWFVLGGIYFFMDGIDNIVVYCGNYVCYCDDCYLLW